MLDVFHYVSSPNVDVQTFYTGSSDWQTWRKPRGAKMIYMIGVGGGASGVGGTFTGTSVAAAGAAGGGSGGQVNLIIPAIFVPDVLYVMPGIGGKAPTTVTSASASVAGQSTYIAIEPGTITSNNIFIMNAPGALGTAARAANAIAAMPLAGRASFLSSLAGQAGGTAGATQNGAGGSVAIPTTGLMVTGGAGSGGKDITLAAGGAGGVITSVGLGGGIYPTGVAAIASTATLDAGDGQPGGMVRSFMYYGGGGGGSGAYNASGVGSTGGAGGDGGPGCGGGASGPGYLTSKRVGSGGDGFAIIISIF